MYFWVKNCAFVNPPISNSNYSGYSGENGNQKQGEQLQKKAENHKIKFYQNLFLLLVISPIPIFFITTGIALSSECEVEPKLPFWMTVIGACFLLEVTFTAIICSRELKAFKSSNSAKNSVTQPILKEHPTLLITLRKSVRLAIFGLSIMGFIWSCIVLSKEEKNRNCTDLVILPSFVLTILVLLFSTFVCIYYSCVVCCTVLDYFEDKPEQ